MQQLLEVQPLVADETERKLKQKYRLEKKLLHYTGKAINDYKLIANGDRLLVCLSGGKDSYTLLSLLKILQKRTKVRFEIHSFTLDQGQPGWADKALKQHLDSMDVGYTVLSKDTYSIVKEKIPENKTYCGLCSRLRRGIIYSFAREHGFNKVVLGHHRDDVIESYLMSIFYNGQTSTMPPKLRTDDDTLDVIRPMIFCQEQDIAAYAKLQGYPIIPCNLCGSQDNLARQKTKSLIKQLASDNPKIPSNILRATQNIQPSHLLDKKIFSF